MNVLFTAFFSWQQSHAKAASGQQHPKDVNWDSEIEVNGMQIDPQVLSVRIIFSILFFASNAHQIQCIKIPSLKLFIEYVLHD